MEKFKKSIIPFIQRLLPIILILIAWEIGSKYTKPLFLPRPEKVLSDFKVLSDNGMLWRGLGASFYRITLATTLSVLIAIPVGLLVVSYKTVDRLITTVTSFMRYIPVTAFYPLLIMWVGIEEKMKIIFLLFATIFFFLPTVLLCIKEVNRDLIDTAYTIGMNKIQVMFKVMLPAALPSICESFLMMYGIGWTYIIIAEMVNAHNGLGYIINIASARGNTSLVFVGVITIILFSVVFDTIGKILIRKLFKWKYAIKVDD
jgi:ABC-type nitrate/sulfonate/bicarbonate transport system permease component